MRKFFTILATTTALSAFGGVATTTEAEAQAWRSCGGSRYEGCRPPARHYHHHGGQSRVIYRTRTVVRTVYRERAAPCGGTCAPPARVAASPCATPCGVAPVRTAAPGAPGGGYVAGAPRNAAECTARGGTDTGTGCRGYR